MIKTRRDFLQLSAVGIGASLFHEVFLLNNLLDKSPGDMKALRRNVGIYTERGGTIGWLISKEGLVVVDTQFPEQSKNLIAKINEQTDRQLDLLINTHHHGDHSGGNIAFKGMVKKVVAHENSLKNQMRVAKNRNQEANQLYPDTTYSTNWSQKVGDETITLHYLGAAHTNGDSVIHFENANIVHMGDLVFNRRFPFIDRSAGASIENWISILANVRKKFDKDTLYIFGHAGEGHQVTGSYKDIKSKQLFLKHLLKFVKKEVKRGKTKEEILKATAIPKAPEWKGRGIERPLTAAYEEITSGTSS